MKKIILCLLSLACISCSSTKVFNSKDIKFVNVTSKENRSPVFYKEYKIKKTGRVIASIDTSNDTSKEKLSDKNAYFLSLYSQYKSLVKLTKQQNELNVCPQFHHEILSANVSVRDLRSIVSEDYKSLMKNPYAVVSNPSLSLNYRGQNVYSYLEKRNMWNKAHSVVKSALIEHNKLNLSELNQLCEEGSSEGFYAYKNMVSFYSTNNFANSSKSMPAFLKIPVLANMLILNNYSKSVSVYEKDLISSLNISWFSNYLDDLKKENPNKEYLSKR